MNLINIVNIMSRYLPERIIQSLITDNPINEIRLRVNRPISFTCGKKNIKSDVCCTPAEMRETVNKLCGGSVHAHGDTIKNGYINFNGNWRAGVCGKAVIDHGVPVDLSEITSINIRIPYIIENVCGEIIEYLKKYDYNVSVLIYSEPSVGKTTLLRDISVKLGKFLRLALIDSRGELFVSELMENTLIDVFYNYPKSDGIEIATRTMAPQMLICDEIGAFSEAKSIISVQNTGVPLIASAHASSAVQLLRRKNIRLLHDNRIFECYIGISRQGESEKYTFDFTDWEAAQCLLNTQV